MGKERKALGVICKAGSERLIQCKLEMKRIIFFTVLSLISFLGNAQNKKQLKELYRQARDSGAANYIILKSKEKKEIKEIDIYKGGRGAGNAILINGDKIKFVPGDIIEYQDDNGFYKLCEYYRIYAPGSMGGTISGQGLAVREYKSTINIYSLSVSYMRSGQKEYQSPITGTYFYSIENNNDGNLIVLQGDSSLISKVENLVTKSAKALEVIKEIRTKYKKYRSSSDLELKLLDAVKLFNADAENGKLED